ncbi:MAG: hypothetical protein HC900_09565 [Methylacidiphilales bacterium]|nr:hypothetical protein [Candidatus Methylacidiphilales bacterium]
MVGLTVIFLLLAARKLYDPAETRALSHWQFAVIAFLVLLILIGVFDGRTLTPIGILGFSTIACLLLVVAIQCFSVGRMEVGDEIWHIKRLVPILRPFDQTVPFLIIVGLGFAFSFELLQKRRSSSA